MNERIIKIFEAQLAYVREIRKSLTEIKEVMDEHYSKHMEESYKNVSDFFGVVSNGV